MRNGQECIKTYTDEWIFFTILRLFGKDSNGNYYYIIIIIPNLYSTFIICAYVQKCFTQNTLKHTQIH